jgi:hypothetical protein
MSPSPKGVRADAYHISTILNKVAEGEIFAVMNLDFKSLIINNCPEADIAIRICGYVRKVQFDFNCTDYVG